MKVIEIKHIRHTLIETFTVFCKDDADITENIRNLAHTRDVKKITPEGSKQSIYIASSSVNDLFIETIIRSASLKETNEHYAIVYDEGSPTLKNLKTFDLSEV